MVLAGSFSSLGSIQNANWLKLSTVTTRLVPYTNGNRHKYMDITILEILTENTNMKYLQRSVHNCRAILTKLHM